MKESEYAITPGAGEKTMAAVFLLLIFGFGAVGLILPDRSFSPQENRYLTMRPALRLQTVLNATYMSRIEEYVTDQFPLRDGWVSFKALCQRLSGQKENNEVYFASDRYLIGKPAEAPEEIAAGNLASVLALANAGYDVALLVSPMAAEVLRDKLPALAYTPVQAELAERLRQEAPAILVDVGSGLRRAVDAGEQVYYRSDHHWTTAGAYAAYRDYMTWLGWEALPREAYEEKVVSTDFYGSLWSKNSLPGTPPDEIRAFFPREDAGADPVWIVPDYEYEVEYVDGADTWQVSSVYQPEYLEQKDQYAYFLGRNCPLTVIRRTDAATGKKLLLFKDSYAHCFVPFLLPHFDEIHLVDLRYWKQNPIAYLEEQEIRQILFLYNADSFLSDRSISQPGAYVNR